MAAVIRCVLVLGVVGCGRHLNPAWCAQPGHVDPACADLPDASAPSCTAEVECPDSTCLPEGTCAVPGSVLQVAPRGTGSDCSIGTRCSLATAIAQAIPARNVIALDGGRYLGPIIVDHAVRIVGHGATLEGPSAGPVVTVTGAVSAELDNVSITGATSGTGVSCVSGALAIHVVTILGNQLGITSSCSLKLDRTIISGNDDGAVAITAGDIDIRNNFIVYNGNRMLNQTSNVTIAAGVTGSFTFNTVAFNDAKANSTPGVVCDSAGLNAAGNLVTDNSHRGMFNVAPQVSGTCDFTRSYTVPGSGGNDLNWVNIAALNFHLTGASTPVLDSPALSCAGMDDFDGQARPFGGRCDYGADELLP